MYYSIVTTRFNNETLNANYFYRKKHNYTCLYCSPFELSSKIIHNSPVFVIEMNNSTNKIEGIGLIKNKINTKKYCKVHQDGNTNRYIYIGNHHINRDILFEYNCKLIYILEQLLFKGKTHSKRGGGLTLFPQKFLQKLATQVDVQQIDVQQIDEQLTNKSVTFEVYDKINIKAEIKYIFVYHFTPLSLRLDTNENVSLLSNERHNKIDNSIRDKDDEIFKEIINIHNDE